MSKLVEFETELSANQTLAVPDSVAQSLPRGKALRVLVFVDSNDSEWEEFAATEFGQGYTDSDSIYDQLSSGRVGPG